MGKNNEKQLKKIFRPSDDNSLFLNAIEHDADFAAYLIQFAIENDVDCSILLDPVDGNCPLHAAIEKGNYQLLEKILHYAATRRKYASFTNGFYETPFELAIKMHGIRSMNAIFRFGVENGVDAVKLLGLEKNRQPALHYAIECRACHEVMRAIVTLARDNGVDVERLFRADGLNKPALHLASCTSSKMVDSVIKLARECGICTRSLTCPDESGNSPLHYAAMEGDEDSLRAILNLATDSSIDVAGLFQPNRNERTPLHCAAINRYHNTFDTLLWWAKNNGVPFHQMLKADSNGQTPLHLLVDNRISTKYEKAAQDILKIAHELSQLTALLKRDRQGKTPLEHAAIKGNPYIARAILVSALQFDPEMLHVLLSSNTPGKTPLHLAVEKGNDGVAVVIMQAAAESCSEMAKTLLAPDDGGRTPLLLALQRRCNSTDLFYLAEVMMRFALKNGVAWRTLIDTKDVDLRLGLKEIFYKQIILEPSIWPRLYPSQSR